MREYEKKYINLLIDKCTNFANTKSILINYHQENRKFIKKLVKALKKRGIKDIYLDEENPQEYHQILEKSLDDIQNSSYFQKNIWNEYAKKNANFLMLKSEYPHLLDDLDIKKVALANKLTLESRRDFYQKQKINEVPWCIACLPSKTWAKTIFPHDRQAYAKLFKLIGYLCLLKEKNPSKAWDLIIKESNKRVKKLNKLHIKTLHYTNSLGTDFKVDLAPDAVWCGVGQDSLCIVNMPSYEVFTSPLYRSGRGTIYTSMPLYYNNQKIAGIFLKFSRGKVVEFDAKIGKKVLQSLLESEKNMAYLGEIALVDKTSPIAQCGLTLGTTLLDENAACHIALGEGFPECLKNAQNLSDSELLKKGLNIAQNHVDMMIGTDDLKIEAITYQGKKISIFVDGKFDI